LFSRRDDVTLANPFAPFGPVSRGYAQVAETIELAARNYTEGELVGFDNISMYLTPELAYVVEVERFRAKVAGRHEKTSLALRVTSIFRMEDDGWKVVHRQADSIVAPRAAESLLNE
jgi:ketosteroid isomerase-like protein